MGTYIYARLINKSEDSIIKANESIKAFGFPTPEFSGVPYGFFTSRAKLEEDAKFLNEDPEGLKQVQHWKRPITVEALQQLFWNEIGCGVIKITGCDDERQDMVNLVRNWLNSADGKRMVDFEHSDNI